MAYGLHPGENTMNLDRTLTRKQRFLMLSLVPIYFMLAGLLMQPMPEILKGLWNIIREPDFLITDY
jgi:hypothetical protein